MQKQLDALPDDVYDRIAEKIEHLAEDPRPDGVVKMKGSDHEYRIRIGDYRVRYEIDDKELIIILLQCKRRKDVYRK
ncbi:MAG: type II toxin-antitoxin system RelE/ParE family toxin [Elainella sp. Prado103]|nr:type II toxin-antitoxin system RelE/ParE family toxin [Elainella sp. Prado103]